MQCYNTCLASVHSQPVPLRGTKGECSATAATGPRKKVRKPIPAALTSFFELSKLFDFVLIALLVSLAVAGAGITGTHHDGGFPAMLPRAALGLLMCLSLLKLGQLAHNTILPTAPSLRVLGAGVVLLQAIEQFGLPGYMSVLGGTVASVGAVSLLLNLHKTLRA
jgi:hypothetical protein